MCFLKKITLFSFACVMCLGFSSHAQFMKKLKDKVNNAVNGNNSNNSNQTTQSESNSTSNGSPTNKKGGGLTNTTPPDVNQQIADAEKSQASGDYSNARYSVQQALMGIELQIGKKYYNLCLQQLAACQKIPRKAK